jgi:putative toxin-antitoxin system antitoxin component (TIGR02293 family)
MASRKVTKTHRVARPAAPSPVFSSLRIQLVGATKTGAIRDKVTHGGVSGATLRDLRQRLSLTVTDLSRVLGAGERTVIRKEQGKAALSPTEADRAYRLARVADLAIDLIGDESKAIAWLRVPSVYLGGETPVAMLDTEVGTDLVIESLYAIAYGGVA